MLDLLKFNITASDRTAAAFKKVKGELGGVKGALAGVNDYAARAGRTMRNMGAGLSAGVTAPLMLMGKQSVQLYDQQVKAENAVAQAILSTGGAAGKTLDDLKGLASGLQGLTTFGDEDILQNVTAPLLTFTKVSGPVFDRAQANVLDMATLLKMDLKSAAVLTGKALNDPVKGLTALSRSGVQFSKEQENVIKALVATGDVAAAQTMILDELETQFKGQAEAAAKAPLGQWKQLSNAIGDLKEELGAEIVPFLTPLAEQLKGAVQWFGELSPEVKKNIVVFGGLAAAVGPVVGVLGMAALGFSALASPMGLVIFGLGAVGSAAAYVVANWDDLKSRFPILEKAAGLGAVLRDAWSNLPAIKWALLIPALKWAAFIPGLRWVSFVPKLSWLALAGGLKWGALIGKLSWAALRVIPVIGWAALAGGLAWSILVKKIEWNGWIPKVVWADWLPRINWSDWIPKVNWSEFLWGVDPAAALQEKSRQIGLTMGREITAGVGLGISNSQQSSSAAIEQYLNNVEKDGRRTIQSNSPSKVWMRVGLDMMEGLQVGVGSGVAGVQGEMRNGLSAVLADAVGMTDAISSETQKNTSILTSFRDGAKGIFTSVLSGAQSFKGALSGILGGFANKLLGSAVDGLFDSIWPMAKGGVMQGGRVTAFAKGGVVNGPTFFPIRGGGTGLMGEAGEEAIMPLRRGPDGKLGVRASGGAQRIELVVHAAEGVTVEQVSQIAGNVSLQITRGAAQMQQNGLGSSLQSYQHRGTSR